MARPAGKSLFSPRYWPTWIGLGLLWVNARANSYGGTLLLGSMLGNFARHLMARRRHVAEVNIGLCFPDVTKERREELLRAHFQSLGISALLLGFSWWAKSEKLTALLHADGLQHIVSALERKRGVIMLGMHFTDLDIVGRLLGEQLKIAVVYRQHENPVVERAYRLHRERHFAAAIPKSDTRGLLRTLKSNTPVWYATDQAMRGKHSALVPFFGIPAPTNTGTSRLAKISGAPVIPAFGYRLPEKRGFRMVVQEPLTDFPSDDPIADTARINRVLEDAIRLAPEQYLWIHRRFKQPRGGTDFYSSD